VLGGLGDLGELLVLHGGARQWGGLPLVCAGARRMHTLYHALSESEQWGEIGWRRVKAGIEIEGKPHSRVRCLEGRLEKGRYLMVGVEKWKVAAGAGGRTGCGSWERVFWQFGNLAIAGAERGALGVGE
jgi:hypothetical protein